MEMELLTTKEMAALLKVKPNTLEVWRSQKRGLPWVRVCGAIRYRRADFEKYLDAQVQATPPAAE